LDGLVEKKYKNKIVIVTGASSGIGKEIANFFLMNDAQVIVCSRRLYLMKINFKKYENVFFFKLDLTKQHEINKLVNFVKKNSIK
jgi:NADP-dependent 3-hydroxy acid dehydrogenase YdfG